MPTLNNKVTGRDNAIVGIGTDGRGVEGWSETQYGVAGESKTSAGVRGTSSQGRGVEGWSNDNFGVAGISKASVGVHGESTGGVGVIGKSSEGRGIEGWSKTQYGVAGESQASAGVRGTSAQGRGVEGWSNDNWGVAGFSKSSIGLHGESETGIGIVGKGGRLAGLFEGDIEVTGDIRLTNADCAEDFDVMEASGVEAGTVMVLSDQGALQPSHQAYDKRVAGVISGAGDYKPGIVLDKQGSQPNRKPIALLGKVFCKADASQAPIEVGDLLTTATIPGHAMRADDPLKAFGSVIGKALRPLRNGQGLIPILIALQ
ncbi:MAG: hypothetical protein P0119_19005 [Nitrospira sp.]|nr:hypothetical protein [Nitrospira sp.]